MQPAPASTANTYLALLENAISDLRMRIRYGENVAIEEVHDFLDAIHNIPIMLRDYGGWHVEENIDWNLGHYDERWLERPGSEMRRSLMKTLDAARRGEYDH
jgi:hypothetical protein